tara:strand:+ start:93576 stop:93983 length:408 start_codon:yes stop_codon:yes gene_type:complete
MKQVISIFLSVLLLASSTGISYAQHFCGDYEMASMITLGPKQLSCDMAVEDDACADEAAPSHNCCDNEYTSVDVDDNFFKANFNVTFNSQFAAALVSVFVLQISEEHSTTQNSYAEYDPPPLVKDIPVLFETFLI